MQAGRGLIQLMVPSTCLIVYSGTTGPTHPAQPTVLAISKLAPKIKRLPNFFPEKKTIF